MDNCPENGVYIVLGEINLLVTAMKRNSRWNTHAHYEYESEPLLGNFTQLKDVLNSITDLEELTPNDFLSAFLDVIRSEDTTGPITGLALTSINKFLAYGLIDEKSETAAAAIENIADAVTHARFVGTDPSSDEVVLMKILHVLRTLILTSAGRMLTNESVCEIMQSCFRICFEMRLSELLRKSAEHTLMDMVQLLFTRLPHFKEDPKWASSLKKLKLKTGGMDSARKFRKKSPKVKQKKVPEQVLHEAEELKQQQVPEESLHEQAVKSEEGQQPSDSKEENTGTEDSNVDSIQSPDENTDIDTETIATTPVAGNRTVVDIQQSFQEADEVEEEKEVPHNVSSHTISIAPDSEGKMHLCADEENPEQNEADTATESATNDDNQEADSVKIGDGEQVSSEPENDSMHVESPSHNKEYINQQGVRFMPPHTQSHGPLIPYGLPCVRELFRFLVSLTNPVDRHNTDVMIHMGLSLLTVALETAADYISKYSSLMCLVKDDMCKNLFFLLQTERLSLFAASVRACFLLFESMRSHLKFQLEMYFTKLMEIITSDSSRISLEQREMSLESVVQLLRIPGLVSELYVNYDCDLYCTNLFEDLMKLLSKNAFPVSGLFSTHLLSLDALLAVTDAIEQHCHHRVLNNSSAAPTIENTDGKSGDNVFEDVNVAPAPPASGFAVGKLMSIKHPTDLPVKQNITSPSSIVKGKRKKPRIKPNRMKVAAEMPSETTLAQVKFTKKLYHTGTEQFNTKPSKGIEFLQKHNLLSVPVNEDEIVKFLKENPKLDKKQIGEYVSNKKNGAIMEAFMRSFNFDDTRVDEALRMFLESFRLPGEAPVISYIIEHFADYWHKSAGQPFANTDAAFTLTYAIIMLNVDQHNTNAKKQNKPMTSAEFKKNLKNCNGGKNFDQDVLEEIYQAISSDEIVMPSEQAGLVRENYLWKVLLKRGSCSEGHFFHVPTGFYDRDLFSLVWGPTVAALSFVFDKSVDDSIVQKAISGFRKCAMIAAHYSMSDVFDNLVISLCKFTTLLSASETPENIPIQFGSNAKAKLAAITVFGLAHRHGDILREGWKNILDCMLQLYKGKLLPEVLIVVEDFLDPKGRISLVKEEKQSLPRTESGVFSSFYSYFTLAENPVQRGPTPEEQEAIRQAEAVIQDCHVDQLIQETKFLTIDSLQELLKALIFASRPENQESSNGTATCGEESAILFLEILVKVVLQNRDRIAPFWQSIQDHFYELVMNNEDHSFLMERAVTGLLRISIRLLRREDIASQVLSSLRILLTMKPNVIHGVCKQISYGLHDLLKTNAANIHSTQDWFTLFTLLEVTGAGVNPPPIMQVNTGVNVSECISDAGAQSDSEVSPGGNISGSSVAETEQREYQSDSELYDTHGKAKLQEEALTRPLASAGSWQMVNTEDVSSDSAHSPPQSRSPHIPSQQSSNQFTITLNGELSHHDNKALMKSCETLAFLVRDAAHVTPHNFESCVHCLRTFVEASIDGGQQARQQKKAYHMQRQEQQQKQQKKRFRKSKGIKKSSSSPSHIMHASDSEEEEHHDSYHSLSIQLLDLMHTLHTRAANIYSSWAAEEENQKEEELEKEVKEAYLDGLTGPVQAESSSLWLKCWCPLLQGIARLCCDTRRRVRSQALTYLQRALLVHDLQTLSPAEWENCFNKVLFPLLHLLLENNNIDDPAGIEETRMRASTLLCKVFLQHLTPLLSLPTFTALWLTILEFMDKYMHADKSDLLCEAVPESLKNMLLVMHTAGILSTAENESQLWKLTWDRIDQFLPVLKDEVFKQPDIENEPKGNVIEREPTPVIDSDNVMQHSSQHVSKSTPTSLRPSGAQSAVPGYTVLSMPETELATSSSSLSSTPENINQTQGGRSPPRSDSPLMQASPHSTTAAPQYVLHPPLPQLSSPKDTQGGPPPVPIILNTDIMQGTAAMPIIHTQKAVDKQHDGNKDSKIKRSIIRDY